MKILHYNIYNGCENDTERLVSLLEYIKQTSADVVFLAELNGWHTNDAYKKYAASAGYEFSYLLKCDSGYNIGAFSKTEIEILEETTVGFVHGFFILRTEGVTYGYTHLTPFRSVGRENEMRLILNAMKKHDEPKVLLGDFNSLNEKDDAAYRTAGAFNMMRMKASQEKRFMKEGEPNYNIVRMVEGEGFVNTVVCDSFEHTYATMLLEEKKQDAKVCVDYIYAMGDFHSSVVKSKIVKSAQVEKLSDHYPIICEW